MRFARAEKARDPDPVGRAIVVVGIKEFFELTLDLIRDDIFLKFDPEAGFVIGLDDPFDRTIDGLFEDVAKCGHAPPQIS
ncbi:hypothetical protein ACVWYP_001778 [Bradyrhizobium sp. USDA 3262]